MTTKIAARPQLAHLTAQLDELKEKGTYFICASWKISRSRSAPTTENELSILRPTIIWA